MPFVLTSGKNLYRAAMMLYMLEMAPPIASRYIGRYEAPSLLFLITKTELVS